MNANKHKFDVNLDLNPHTDETYIKLDGKALSGVTDITIRAGANGFTNVVLGMEVSALATLTGELSVNAKLCDEYESCLFQATKDALEKHEKEWGAPFAGREQMGGEMAGFASLMLESINKHLPTPKEESNEKVS